MDSPRGKYSVRPGDHRLNSRAPRKSLQMTQEEHKELKRLIAERVSQDSGLLTKLRDEVKLLKAKVTKIQPRPAHSVAIVATDGGENKFHFDPYLIQVVRVVDSANTSHSVDVASPSTEPGDLLKRHFDANGNAQTPLGRMMKKLNVNSLHALSSMIPEKSDPEHPSAGWLSVLRELQEWAVLLDLACERWGSDTLLIFDGLLRTKKFSQDLFAKYRVLLEKAIADHKQTKGKSIYVAGFSKDNQVLTRYRLALALENILKTSYPAYLEIPRAFEISTYKWKEWARGDDLVKEGEEANKFVGGKLFFGKFGSQPEDRIWPVDILQSQVSEVQTVMGCLLNDSLNGFPIPNYPRSLQAAHENASQVGFDNLILEDSVFKEIRDSLGGSASIFDGFRLSNSSE